MQKDPAGFHHRPSSRFPSPAGGCQRDGGEGAGPRSGARRAGGGAERRGAGGSPGGWGVWGGVLSAARTPFLRFEGFRGAGLGSSPGAPPGMRPCPAEGDGEPAPGHRSPFRRVKAVCKARG